MPRRVFLFCTLLLALAALYTIASAWITVERIGRLDAAGNAAAQSQQVLSALHAFATAAVDIESGARGYALTGNDAYLQPFELARRQAPPRLDELRDLLRAEPRQLARVERLTALLAERIGISEHGIAQKRASPDAPFEMRFGSRGRETSEEIRRIVEDIESDERHDVANRKIAWQQELERARTTEALSAMSSLTVITLSLWALLRLRRTETAAAPSRPSPPSPQPTDVVATPPPPAADFDALVDEALRRAALLQASHPPQSAERARIQRLRDAIEAARAGVAPADGAVVIERLGLPTALSALAHNVREQHRCTVRESIDDVPSLAAAAATLLFEAASWALDVLCSRRPAGEIGIGLAADDAQVVLRIESPLAASTALVSEHDAQRELLAQRFAAAGGTFQWSAGDSGQELTATLPTSPQPQAESTDSEPIRA